MRSIKKFGFVVLALICCAVSVKAAVIKGTGTTSISTAYGDVHVTHYASFNTGTNNRWTSGVERVAVSVTGGAYGTGSVTQKVDPYDGHLVKLTVKGTLWYPSGSNSSDVGYANYRYNGSSVNTY